MQERTSVEDAVVRNLHLFATQTNQKSTQSLGLTMRKFLSVIVSDAYQIDTVYPCVAGDLKLFKKRADGKLRVYTNPTVAARYEPSFYEYIFSGANIDKVVTLPAYQTFKSLHEEDLKIYENEWEKVQAYFLTALMQKGVTTDISTKLNSKTDALELMHGVGQAIAAMSFTTLLGSSFQAKFSDSDSKTDDTKKMQDTDELPTLLKVANTVVHTKTLDWNKESKAKLRDCGIICDYKELFHLKNHFPTKKILSHMIASVVTPATQWESVNEQCLTGIEKTTQTQTDLVNIINQREDKIKDWNTFLEYFDYVDVSDFIATNDVSNFAQLCQKAISKEAYGRWTDKGLVKKFITANTIDWKIKWDANWKLNESLQRTILKYKNRRKAKIGADFIETLINL